MTDTEPAQDVQDAQPSPPRRLTRRALFDLRLEEMRQRGESTEGMSRYAPTATISTEDSDERHARVLALIEAHGITSLTSSVRAEREREAEECERWAQEEERKRREAWGPRMRSSVPSSPIDFTSWTDPPSPEANSRPSSVPDRVASHDISQPFDYNQRLDDRVNSALSDNACDGSNWNHSVELQRLRDEMLEAAKPNPESRPLFRTFDASAFAGEGIFKNDNDDNAFAASDPAVPAGFPPYLAVDGMVELGTYLAASSYIVSLGGPPLPDLKYGIVILPTGEESLLFAGYGDHAGMSAAFKEQVYAKSKAAKMEQDVELRQKAAEEFANGVGSEPELDDDDREFYKQRWMARTGREVVASALDGDALPVPTAEENGSRCLSVPGLDNVDGLPQEDGDVLVHEASGHSQVTPAPAAQDDATADSPRVPGEHKQVRSTASIRTATSVRSKRSQTSSRGADILTRAESELCTPEDQPGAALSTPSILRKTEERMSPEACRALERLLRGEKKRRGTRRVLNSLFPNSKLKNPASPAAATKRILLEVSEAIASLANDEMCDNPGINRRVWEAARKDLALRTAP